MQHVYLAETSPQVLEGRLKDLVTALEEEERAGPKRKGKRRTIRKQMGQIEERITNLYGLMGGAGL
jgi:hypothetical protein